MLEHVILSHHGNREFGSPVEPHIVEAQILNEIDQLDAKMYVIEKLLSETKKNS